MEEKRSNSGSNGHGLGWACAGSTCLLVLFGAMQSYQSPVLGIRTQWLWIALLPILIVLITGRYIGKLKGPWFEYEQYRFGPEERQLTPIPPQGTTGAPVSDATPSKDVAAQPASASWMDARDAELRRTRGLFLVHRYKPSKEPGQKYDVTIFLLRHVPGESPNQREGFSEIEKMELYLGPSWGTEPFTAPNNGGPIGIRTAAWGSFLAIGRITFRDGTAPLSLKRYVDFEMAPKKPTIWDQEA